MIIYSSSTIVITYDRDSSIIAQKWTGYTPSLVFREAIDKTFEFMKKNDLYRIISDIREQKVVAPREQEYAKDSAINFYRQNENLRIAIVAENNSIVMACAQRYNKSVRNEVSDEINRFFEDSADAMSWLMCEEKSLLPECETAY